MVQPITRRHLLAGAALAALAIRPRFARAQGSPTRFADLEGRSGGRLGLVILNTGTGRRYEHRAHERFAMCSTFKWLAAAAILARVDRGEEKLDRRVSYSEKDLVANSPITRKNVAANRMNLAEICEAAITVSDNTAGNLQLGAIGGPAGFTAFARSLGDDATRLDRIETDLNAATPGDVRDTTTPAAMLANMQKLLLGDGLSRASREQLIAWLVANKTGGPRLRAGLPKEWRVGDKPGLGGYGTNNDVAIVWPAGKPPILIAAYFTGSALPVERTNAVLAEVGQIAAELVDG